MCVLRRNVCLGLLPIFLIAFFVYFFLILSCMSCLYILEIKPSSMTSFVNILSHCIGFFFFLFMVFFVVQKFLSLIRFLLFIFTFIYFALGDQFKKVLLWFMLENVLPMFTSRNFRLSHLIFKSWSHCEFIFVYGMTECYNVIDLHVTVQLPQYQLSFLHCKIYKYFQVVKTHTV